MKNKISFKKWIQANEVFLPPDAMNPPAMVVKADNEEKIMINKLKADLEDVEKKLDLLKVLTSVNPEAWHILNNQLGETKGLYNQDQLESFIERFKRHNDDVINNLGQMYKDLTTHPPEPKPEDFLTSKKMNLFFHRQAYLQLLSYTKEMKEVLSGLKPGLKGVDSNYLAEVLSDLNDAVDSPIKAGAFDKSAKNVASTITRNTDDYRRAAWERVKEKYKDDNTGIGRHFKGEMPADWMDEER